MPYPSCLYKLCLYVWLRMSTLDCNILSKHCCCGCGFCLLYHFYIIGDENVRNSCYIQCIKMLWDNLYSCVWIYIITYIFVSTQIVDCCKLITLYLWCLVLIRKIKSILKRVIDTFGGQTDIQECLLVTAEFPFILLSFEIRPVLCSVLGKHWEKIGLFSENFCPANNVNAWCHTIIFQTYLGHHVKQKNCFIG